MFVDVSEQMLCSVGIGLSLSAADKMEATGKLRDKLFLDLPSTWFISHIYGEKMLTNLIPL